MKIAAETLVKLEILTRGVVFSDKALSNALAVGAKQQNSVYNLPKGAQITRPQELFIKGNDGYTTVASCITPVKGRQPVQVDINESGVLIVSIDETIIQDTSITFVKEPRYYRKTVTGESVKRYVSACGYDEVNILPWRGCAISKGCKFCGINTVSLKDNTDELTAFSLSSKPESWEQCKVHYLQQLNAALNIAINDKCYSEHAHVILISGNLSNDKLDLQADIYSEIAKKVKPIVKEIATEGIVAVITPPKDSSKLVKMKKAGIDIVVFNMEVGNDPWFTKYCPGKAELGREFFIEKLNEAINVFGPGKVWSNFVLGLEPIEELLNVCRELAKSGIVSGANILHIDQGNQLDCPAPDRKSVVWFYYELAQIYNKFGFKPYYCSKALRTSLINEVYDERIQ